MSQNHKTNNNVIENTTKSTGRVKKVLVTSVTIIVLMMIGMMALSSLSVNQVIGVNQTLQNYNGIFLIFRYTVMIAISAMWAPLMTIIANKQGWSDQHRDSLIHKNWQVVGLFFILEAVFNHRTYIDLLQG